MLALKLQLDKRHCPDMHQDLRTAAVAASNMCPGRQMLSITYIHHSDGEEDEEEKAPTPPAPSLLKENGFST